MHLSGEVVVQGTREGAVAIIAASAAAVAVVVSSVAAAWGKINRGSLKRIEPQIEAINHAVNDTSGPTLTERLNDVHHATVPGSVAPTDTGRASP